MQNEANGLGILTESDRHSLTSRGMPILEQQRSGPQYNNTSSVSFGNKEFPMNFDFLGGQQQMNGQQPGLQSLAHQQSGTGDAQLLQQQTIRKQMQEFQRQQQILQAMQRNTMNQMAFSNQAVGNHAPAFINGTPMHSASNYPLSSQLVMGSTNWLQRGDSSTVQGYSNGVAMSPEHGQSLPLMGLIPQQGSQSFYGVPISNARSAVGFLPNQLDKTGLHELPIQRSSSSDQTPGFMEQASLREGTMVTRQGFEGKSLFEHASSQGSGHTISYETFNQMQQKALPELDGRQDVAVSLSSSLPLETVKQVSLSQPPVELDPTEQRILFGGEDNIWDAFGETLTGSNGSFNDSDGTFPSTHSGSWSALMQSAVAETSGSDIGPQGEWHGVGVQKSGSQNRNQQLLLSADGGRQPVGRVDRLSMPSLGSRPFPEANLNAGYHHLGLDQTSTNQPKEFWQDRSIHQTPEEGKKWSDYSQPKAIAEGTHINELAHSSGNYNSKNTAGSWSHQHSISSLPNRSGGLNSIQSVSGGGGTVPGGMNVNVGHGEGLSMLNSVPHPNLGMERCQINSKDDPRISDKHPGEFWRPVSSVQSGVDGPGTYQQYPNKGMQQLLDSSMNSSEHGATDTPEAGKNDKREHSSDSYSSNLSNRASTGGLRENVWFDAGNRHCMSGGKQNPSLQVGQETHGPRKFQYHPMGDVHMDTEHSYGTKNIMQSQATTHNLAGVLKNNEGQSRILVPSTKNSGELDKGDIRVSYGISSSGIGPSYVSSAPASFDKADGTFIPINSVTSSQNMLELLQKVDQSKEHNAIPHLSSNDWDRSSGISQTEASDGDAGLSPKQPSSQGYGLQLAPPSQGLPAPSFTATSRSFEQSLSSPSSSYVASDKGDKADTWLASAVSVQSLPSVHESHPGDAQVKQSGIPGQIRVESSHNMQANFPASFPSGSMFLRSMLQNQQMAKAGGHSSHASVDGQASHDKQMNDEGRAGQSVQVPYSASGGSISHVDSAAQRENSGATGMHQKGKLPSMVSNPWSNVATVQQLLAAQSLNAADLLKNRFQSNNILGTSGLIQQRQDGQDPLMNGDAANSQDIVGGHEQSMARIQIDTTGKTASALQGKESSANNPFVPNNAASEKEIEAFGRSLKPNTSLVDSYSLLHQMRAMKEMDPSNQPVKRFKGMDDGAVDAQVIERSSHTIVSHDLSSGKGEPQKSSGGKAVPIPEHSQVSLQMAPTWFEQYGSFKNRPLVPMHDAQRAQAVVNSEQQFMIGKSVKDLGPGSALGQVRGVVDTGQMANVWQTTSYAQREGLSSHHPLTSSATASIASLRPKKRKSAVAERLPWHREVTLGSLQLHDMSLAEEDWAQAAHCLIEKIEDEIDVHEDVPPVIRSRRRLVLTMQLMQHIFRPPPAAILSLDATTEYESVAYNVARLAFGDACSLLCQSESDSCMSRDDENLHSEEHRVSDRTSDQHRKKLVQDFINKARMLENDLLRLDKRVSVLDVRLECQDLERFSIINRFARFHGRGQVDGAETSSSSDATAAAQRVYPQRYVNVYSMPKNLPERVQCLSL